MPILKDYIVQLNLIKNTLNCFRSTNQILLLDSRETAPKYSNLSLCNVQGFWDKGCYSIISLQKEFSSEFQILSKFQFLENEYSFFALTTFTAGCLIGVPGEVRGLTQFHSKFGRLPWKKVMEPVLRLAKNGYQVTNYLEFKLDGLGIENIKNFPGFSYRSFIFS